MKLFPEVLVADADGPVRDLTLVLLEVSLPGIDGLQVLQQARNGNHCPATPFVLFTNSRSPDDFARACECRANSFVLKPDAAEAHVDMAQRIATYWFESNLTPLSL